VDVNSGEFAIEDLSSDMYRELRGIAARQIARVPSRTSLRPTELVHEAFLRLVGPAGWRSRAHFFGAAARAIRYTFVDYLRSRGRAKRHGGLQRVSLSGVALAERSTAFTSMALHEALDRLERHDARCARTVVLRVVSGMTMAEIAATLSVSEATAERDWTYGRAWLYRDLRGSRT